MGPIPSVKPVNINEASGPETSLLLIQNEQLWRKQTGSGALGLPHAELQAKGRLLACPPAAVHASEDKLEHKSGTWLNGASEIAMQPTHTWVGMALVVPTTHQQKNANTWQSASWVPKCGAVGYFRRQSAREANKVPGDLPPGRSWARGWGTNLNYRSMAPQPRPAAL